MTRIRPSLVLQVGVPDKLQSDIVLDEIKRSFSYIAAVVFVRQDEIQQQDLAADDSAQNEDTVYTLPLRMTVRLHKPYWDRSNDEAQEIWSNAVEPWLANMFAKVSGAMKAFVKLEHQGFEGKITFNPLEVQFDDNCTVGIDLHDDSSIPENALALVNGRRDCDAGIE